jgi:hypothetical protein
MAVKTFNRYLFFSNLLQADIIEPVSGYGKEKYKFKKMYGV